MASSRAHENATQSSVSIRNFGAIGNGVTDDYPAALAAISYLVTLGGGKLILPRGRYLFNSSLQINSPSIYLEGEGNTVSYIVNGTTNLPAISFGDGVTQYYSGGVSKLGFTGKAGITGVSGQLGLKINKFGQMVLENLRVDSSGSALYKGVNLVSVSQTFYNKVAVQSCLSTGVDLLGVSDLYMESCRSDANGTVGFLFNGCQGVYAGGCTAYGNTTQGWYFLSGDPVNAPNKNNFFTSCIGDTSGSYNWVINDSRDSMFTNCWGCTQLSAVVNTFAAGFILSGQYCKDLMFTGCIAEYNNSHGFVIDSSVSAPTKITFNNCTFGATGHGNGRSGAGSGLSISGGANVITDVRVNGGSFSDNATSPIVNNSTGDVRILGNPIGYNNEQTGVVSVTSGTSIAITFPQTMIASPQVIQITPWWNSGTVWASSITTAGFTINWVNAASPTVFFSWSAKR